METEEKTKAQTQNTASTDKKVKKKEAQKDLSASYNEFKEFEGQHYTGMQVGRSHKWNYDAGIWKETKITPDLWEISYAVTKRRTGHAPEGSGVPVGTAYHWYILAHQNVRKLNANEYTTSMTGLKFKIAHKRADKEKWSASSKTQRKRMVKFLKEVLGQLEKEPIPLQMEVADKKYRGEAIPISQTCDERGICFEYDITLNDESLGILRNAKSGWKMDGVEQPLVDAIGNELVLWFE